MRRFGVMAAGLVMAACTTTPPATGPATPEDVDWTLARLAGQPARSAGEAPGLRLESSTGRARGNTGCNGFSGPYDLRGDSISFGALVSTRRACVDPAMNRQEADYIGVLGAARTWRISGDTLEISGAGGRSARLIRAAP